MQLKMGGEKRAEMVSDEMLKVLGVAAIRVEIHVVRSIIREVYGVVVRWRERAAGSLSSKIRLFDAYPFVVYPECSSSGVQHLHARVLQYDQSSITSVAR